MHEGTTREASLQVVPFLGVSGETMLDGNASSSLAGGVKCNNLYSPSFNGIWDRASIGNGVLTWNEGEDVTIRITSTTTFQMRYDGKDHSAELQDDGRLHWEDGDMW